MRKSTRKALIPFACSRRHRGLRVTPGTRFERDVAAEGTAAEGTAAEGASAEGASAAEGVAEGAAEGASAAEGAAGGAAAAEGAAATEEGAAACGREQFMAAVRRQDPLRRLGLELDDALQHGQSR